MKKCMAELSVIGLVMSLMLTACTATPGAEANVSEPASEIPAAIETTVTPSVPIGIDRTVDISVLDPFEPPVEETPPERSGVALLEFAKIYFGAEDLSEDAKDIVVGEVLATYYTDVDASGMIFYDFKVSEVLRGDLGAGDTITVASYGGYVRMSVFKQVHGHIETNRPLTEGGLLLYSGVAPFPAVGDQYVLFMLGCDYIRYTAGVYDLCGGFMGQYFLDGESVKRYLPKDEPYFYTKHGTYFDAKNPIPNDPKTLSALRTVVAETPLIDRQVPAD